MPGLHVRQEAVLQNYTATAVKHALHKLTDQRNMLKRSHLVFID
jgi:hypothetical protein